MDKQSKVLEMLKLIVLIVICITMIFIAVDLAKLNNILENLKYTVDALRSGLNQ